MASGVDCGSTATGVRVSPLVLDLVALKSAIGIATDGTLPWICWISPLLDCGSVFVAERYACAFFFISSGSSSYKVSVYSRMSHLHHNGSARLTDSSSSSSRLLVRRASPHPPFHRRSHRPRPPSLAALIVTFTIVVTTIICTGIGEIWNDFTLLQAYEAFEFVELKGVKIIQNVLSRSSFKDPSVSIDASRSDLRTKFECVNLTYRGYS
jgi:hypothetical protein